MDDPTQDLSPRDTLDSVIRSVVRNAHTWGPALNGGAVHTAIWRAVDRLVADERRKERELILAHDMRPAARENLEAIATLVDDTLRYLAGEWDAPR